MTKTKSYTSKQLKEFRELVEMGESSDQMERIYARLKMPKFLQKVGKEKCDEMMIVLKEELAK